MIIKEQVERALSTRHTQVISLSELDREYLHPESIRIQLCKKIRKAPIDIGSLAYSYREFHQTNNNAKSSIKVDTATLSNSRRIFLGNLFEYFFNKKPADSTVSEDYRAFKTALDWFDTNNHSNILNSIDDGRNGYTSYVNHLFHLIKVGQKSPAAASFLQRKMNLMLSIKFGKPALAEITRDIRIIRSITPPTESPHDHQVENSVKLALCIARQFKDIVIKKTQLPTLLKMPGYSTYLFPHNGRGVVTPFTKKELDIYNYSEGRIATAEEYIEKKGGKLRIEEAKIAIESSTSRLHATNTNPRSEYRLRYALFSVQAYIRLFIMISGAYPSELFQLEYSKEYELKPDLYKNDFRAVKFRANGRIVSYSLGDSYGYKLLQEYLEIREWLLNGSDYKYLFFTFKRAGTYIQEPKPFTDSYLAKYGQRVKGIFAAKDHLIISSQRARKYKSQILYELKQDPLVVSEILNHTPRTNTKSYIESNSNKTSEELSNFWNSTREARKLIAQSDFKGEPVPSGHCNKLENPKTIDKNSPIEPNCTTQFGCLYCQHYTCHADSEDLKKLLSMQYVIKELLLYAKDISHSEKLYRGLDSQIDEIISDIKKISPKHKNLALKIEKEVMKEGKITPFWNSRLYMYQKIGVVL